MRRSALIVLLLLALVFGLRALIGEGSEREQPNSPLAQTQLSADARVQASKAAPVAEGRTLVVAVADASARPIQAARVCLVVAERSVADQRCVTTDSAGVADGLRLPTGERWRIAVSAEGFQPTVIPRPGSAEPRGELVRVTLRRGGVELSGVIEDATGGVIEGALVTIEAASGGSLAATLSDREGRFEAWASPGHVSVRAAATGYAATTEQLVLPSGPVTLTLMPESIIAGRVLDAESGEPLDHALVSARLGNDGIAHRSDNVDRFTASSDEDGRYELTGLPAGVFELTSQGPWGFGASEGSVVVELGSRVDDVDILVHRGTSLRIRVVTAGDQQGCSGAAISLVEENTGHVRIATTDAAGAVELSLPVAGTYRVGARCEGYRLIGDEPTIDISGSSGDREELLLEVDEGRIALGQVIAESDRAPIPDAVVALIPAHGTTPAAIAMADSEGRVELSGLQDGDYVALASAPGWFPVEAAIRVEVPSTSSFELPLRSGGSLVGTVLEPGGGPIPEARVLAQRRATNGRWRGETIVDAEGRFDFGQLPPGEFQIDVMSSTGQALTTPAGQAARADVRVDAGDVTEQDFVVAAAAGVITGTVVDDGGGPVATAFVCAEPTTPAPGALPRQRCAPRMTDVDGSFELRDLQSGTYTLTARVRGSEGEASLPSVEIGDNVELVIQRTGSITGTARYASDASTPDLLIVEVVRTDAAVARQEAFLRTEGEWSIEGLPSGEYTLRIRASAGSGAAKAEVTSGGRSDVGEVELDDRTLISGRVVRLETNEPIAGFRVVATSLDAQLRSRYTRKDARNVSDAQGRFVVSDPPPGRVTLHVIPSNLDARPPDLTEAHLTLTVDPGRPHDVGDIPIPTRRLSEGTKRANFGFVLDRWDHVGDQADQVAKVIEVDAEGPAAAAGLRVGDIITAIDGYDIVGRRYLLQYLLIAPIGTQIELDTERAAGISLIGE